MNVFGQLIRAALESLGADPAAGTRGRVWYNTADSQPKLDNGAAVKKILIEGQARTDLAAGTADHVLINNGSGAMSSEAQLAISRGGTGAATAQDARNALLPTQTGHASEFLTTDGTNASWGNPPSAPTSSQELSNLGLAASVAANALTIALKQSDGSTNPNTGSSAVKIGFRSSTITSGAYNQRSVTGALSLVISSGSTLGHADGVSQYIYVYAIDNAGTVELAASSSLYDDGTRVTTTAEGGAGGADSSSAIYSTTARTDVPVRLIGRLTSSQATAGTWASAITQVSVVPFNSFPLSEVVVHTGNGHGSTNTAIRRFTTTQRNVGKSITYADSATNGASFTINENGIYAMSYSDSYSAGEVDFGISVNSSQLTTEIWGITAADVVVYGEQVTANRFGTVAATRYFKAGDVVRPHTNKVPNVTTSLVKFTIKRIA